MKRDIEDLKKELVLEIKELAADIASSQSYVGLLFNEIKFRSLQEKFINLKFLERKQYGLEIFESDVVVEFPEEIASQATAFEEVPGEEIVLKPQENTAVSVSSNDNNESNVAYTESTEDSETINTEEYKVNEDIPPQIDNSEPASEEENESPPFDEVQSLIQPTEFDESLVQSEKDLQNSESAEEAIESTEVHKIVYPKSIEITPEEKKLLPIQLDLNDQLAFQYQLFEGDRESMDMVIKTINAIQTLSDSKKYLTDLQSEMLWTDKEEYVERLEALIIKRFE